MSSRTNPMRSFLNARSRSEFERATKRLGKVMQKHQIIKIEKDRDDDAY